MKRRVMEHGTVVIEKLQNTEGLGRAVVSLRLEQTTKKTKM